MVTGKAAPAQRALPEAQPLRYAIQVVGRPRTREGTGLSLQFIKAVLHQGHQVIRVFFYRDGVYHAYPGASGEGAVSAHWSRLQSETGLDLVVCTTAAERRGLGTSALAPGFRPGGLGQWLEASLEADRCLVLGH